MLINEYGDFEKKYLHNFTMALKKRICIQYSRMKQLILMWRMRFLSKRRFNS